MGQLGVIYEAEIKIIKLEEDYVKNELDSSASSFFINNYFYWFPFFIENEKKDSLKYQLLRFNQKLKSIPELKMVKIYINEDGIKIKFKKFNPPLLVNFNKDISSFGLKIFINKSEKDFTSKIKIIRNEIDSFLRLNSLKSYF